MAEKAKYPLAMTSDGKKKKSKLKKMKPEAFLEAARKLTVGEGDRDIINKFKEDIESQEPMGPLKLYEDGTEDGRHRATAAEELGLDSVPVIDERTRKALGGALNSNDPNRFMQDVLKFSFAVLPLLRTSYLKEVPKQGFAHGGHVLEDDYPTQYLSEVGRQVMADGGASRFAAMDPSMLIGTSAPPPSSPGAYTDVGGQKIAAPFVTRMRGGYPVYEAPVAEKKAVEPAASSILERLRSLFGGRFGSYAEGGPVEGEVSYAPDDVEQALRTAQEVVQKPSPFEEKPREATLQAYEPTLREKIYGAVAGTSEARPTAERASFAHGVTDLLGMTPVLGQAMQAQEAARSGDSKGVALAMLPIPGAKIAEEAATTAARRLTNPLGMHSPGAEAARALPQEKGTVEQVFAMLRKQVPESELQQSGLEEALKGKTHTTREEVAQHFENALPQLEEKVYGGKPPAIPEPRSISNIFREYEAPHHLLEGFEDVHRVPGPGGSASHWIGERPEGDGFEVYTKDFTHLGTADTMDEAKDLIGHSLAGSRAPLFKDYSLPGGSNYREVVLHEPGAKSAYKSSHFSDPNYVAHLRMKDYELPEGGKGLLVDELQSDRAQAARKKGFKDEAPYMGKTEHWTDLTLKRALKDAIEGGYDRLMITPGTEQAERYGLQKKVGRLRYSPDDQILEVFDPRGTRMMNQNVKSPEELHDLIGKELSQKLLAAEQEKAGNRSFHILEGDDLAFGGEGMKGYYDKIVPGRLEKLLRKYDKNVKIEPYDLGTDGESKTVHSIRITPELRQALQEKGLPAYRKGGKVDNALNLVRKLAGTPA